MSTTTIRACRRQVANVMKFVLERHTSMADGPRDGLSGFLVGVAIATLSLGIWRMRRVAGPRCFD
jgi:hypothetical protein